MELVIEKSKKTDVGIIPSDWECKELRNYSSYITYGFTNPMPTVLEGVLMVTANDINKGVIKYETARKTTEFAFNNLLSNKSKPRKNDILLTKDGSLGRLALVGDEKICVNQSVAVIRPNDKVYPQFLKILLEGTYYQKTMIDNAGGSTIKHIYITIVDKMKVAIPPTLAEQTAIAYALSDADALITGLEKLIAKKRYIKQGAMQRLLQPKEGWEVKKFKDLCWFQEGPGLRNWQFTKRGIKVINVTNLVNGVLNLDRTSRHISYDEFNKMYQHFEIDENDIVVASSGNSYGKVAVVRKQDLPLVMNTSVIRFKPLEYLDYNFLLTFLKSNQFKDQIDLLITGGAQPNFGPAHLNKIYINLPPTKEEQTRIAMILSDMDLELKVLELKLEKYKKIKLGMMQELLTGKTRLV